MKEKIAHIPAVFRIYFSYVHTEILGRPHSFLFLFELIYVCSTHTWSRKGNIHGRVIPSDWPEMHISKGRCFVYPSNMPSLQDKQGLKFNILYVILKKPTKPLEVTSSIFFHTPQNCADKNWGVFSKTYIKADLHVPSLLSSSLILQCCFNVKNHPTY